MDKIIITGGTGYIGSHTAVELINNQFECILIDNLSNSDKSVLSRIEQITGVQPTFVKADLSDPEQTEEVLSNFSSAKAVLNFAALKAVGESVQLPLLYYRNNLNIVINLLQSMENQSIPNFIFSSSATVYGIPNHLPITENENTKRPESPYGNTKKIAEEILEDYCKVHPEFNAISLRYFNPIGAHHSGLLGEAPNGVPNNLMPYITQTAIGKRDELKVFGQDYDTKDGTAIRDYLHVEDLAKAHVFALNRMRNNESNLNFELFNIGTGAGYSVLEVIQSFEQSTGEKLKWSFAQRREGDVPVLYADPSKANKLLGWEASKTLDDMTKSSWDWEKKRN